MANATHDPQLLKGLSGISTGTVYPVLNRLEREGLLGSRLVASIGTCQGLIAGLFRVSFGRLAC